MSEVSICNQALSLVGSLSNNGNIVEPLTSLDDNTKEAKLCKLNYEPVRDAVLSEHDWSFATRWEDLPASADPSPGEYPNEFPLPSDVLTVLFVGLDYRHQENWQVENNAIRTDAQTCRCQVIYRVTDTSKFSALFTQALVARLAGELAIPITNSRTLMENLFQMYGEKVKLASSRDSQQGRSRRLRSKWLVGARYRDGYRGDIGPTV